jgi:predicted acylesterase/phospholipase RssA
VRSGKLECTTNNLNAVHIPRVHYKKLDSSKSVDKFMDGVKTGVFASMDLPPLFPYIKMDDDFFEDGGVIDNLPITFAAMEGCDLIFVLPLNSDFYAEPDERSVINRFFRVMDVRQGVLERNNLKLLYLYNEIAALRKHVDDIRSVVDVPPDLPVTNTLSIALSRTNQHLRIFAVCPLKMFVQGTIDTQELWKPRQAGVAFDVMYRTTMELLEQKFDPAQERIQVALVSREGDFTWDENF